MKRGNIEVVLLLAVAVIAAVGLVFVLYPSSESSGMVPIPYVDQSGEVRMTMLECQSACFGRPVGAPRLSGQPLSGYQLRDCLANCQTAAGVAPDQYTPGITGNFILPEVADVQTNSITGKFTMPAAKAYGGEIRGVAAPGTRAFPAGRAYELPDQACYTCSCMPQGITAADRNAAERVCGENCGGSIVDVTIGEC